MTILEILLPVFLFALLAVLRYTVHGSGWFSLFSKPFSPLPRSELHGFSFGGANPQTKFHSLDLVQSVDLLERQFCNESLKVLYTNPTGMNDTTELMRGRIQEFLQFRCEQSSDQILGFEFVESEEEIVRAYNNYKAAEEAESSQNTNLTRIVAGLVFKEFS